MLSICGSIYKNPVSIEKMVRSTISSTSNPDNLEFVIVHDDADYDVKTGDVLKNLQNEFVQVKVIYVTRKERIDYIKELISFYKRYSIFPEEDINDFNDRLDKWVNNEIHMLWIPPGRNINTAISYARGDVIIVAGLDIVFEFDIEHVYQTVKQRFGDQDFAVHFTAKVGSFIIHNNHGMRIFNKQLFYKVFQQDIRYSPRPFSFEERWFNRELFDDMWNEKVRKYYTLHPSWIVVFGEHKYVRHPEHDAKDSYIQTEYLTSKSLINVDNTQYFLRFIDNYYKRYNAKY